MLSRRLTISCTCSFCAPPVPTTASFTSRGAYSNTRGRTANVALSAAPRACPSLSALSALRCMNTRSMATSSGRNSLVERLDAGENLLQALGQRLAAGADRAADDVGDARRLRLDDCVAGALRSGIEAEDPHLGRQCAGALRQRQRGKTLRAPESAQGFLRYDGYVGAV